MMAAKDILLIKFGKMDIRLEIMKVLFVLRQYDQYSPRSNSITPSVISWSYNFPFWRSELAAHIMLFNSVKFFSKISVHKPTTTRNLEEIKRCMNSFKQNYNVKFQQKCSYVATKSRRLFSRYATPYIPVFCKAYKPVKRKLRP